MGIKVYFSEISAHKEVKKRQQKVMMILESKQIPYEAIDITEAGKETEKDFMLANAKAKGESKYAESPQVFNEENYCGDYDDFELANENDELESFLNIAKVENTGMIRIGNQNGVGSVVSNGTTSRENSAEKEKVEQVTSSSEPVVETNPEQLTEEAPAAADSSHPEMDEEVEEEPMSTTEQPPVTEPPPPHPEEEQEEEEEELLENVKPDSKVKDGDEEEEEEVED